MNFRDILKATVYRNDIELFFKEELHITPSKNQLEFLEWLADLNNDKILVIAGRGAGKTKMCAGFALWAVIPLAISLNHPYFVAILGGSKSQSDYCYGYIRDFLTGSEWLSSFVKGDILRSEVSFSTGGKVTPLPAGPKSIRGIHPDCLILDEGAEIERKIAEAALPTTSTSPFARTIWASTGHVPDCFFLDVLQKADVLGYKVFIWSALASDAWWVNKKKVEKDKLEMGTEKWEIEYLAKSASLMDTLISNDDFKRCIVESTVFDPTLPTIAGCDWGEVHSAFLVLQRQGKISYVLEAKEWKRVKLLRIEEEIKRFYEKYEIDTIQADASIPGYSPIVIRDEKGLIDVLPIEELINFKGEEEICSVIEPIEILSSGNTFKRLYGVYRHPWIGSVLRLSTRTSSVDVTPNHPMLSWNSKTMRADKLGIGQKLANRTHPVFIDGRHGFFLGNKNLAWLLGLFVAEGNQNGDFISLSNKDTKLIRKAKKLAKKELNLGASLYKDKKDCFHIHGKNSKLASWFKTNCYTLRRKKRVPKMILNAPSEIREAFLEGFYAGDGSKSAFWKITSNSQALIQGIYILLKITKGHSKREITNYLRTYPRKEAWDLALNKGRSRKDSHEITQIRELPYQGYVYDVTVDYPHSFITGIGFTKVHNSHPGMNERLITANLHVKPVHITKEKKPLLQDNLKWRSERGTLKIDKDKKKLLEELSVYTSTTKRNDHLVDALMLALDGEKGLPAAYPQQEGLPVAFHKEKAEGGRREWARLAEIRR